VTFNPDWLTSAQTFSMSTPDTKQSLPPEEAKDITLEQQAHNDGYKRLDVLDKCPSNNCCVDGGSDCLVSGVDMEKVCADVNQSGLKVTSVVSHDQSCNRQIHMLYTF
jgi:hypothetical protein